MFDTCNPFLARGTPAVGLGVHHYLPFDSLMERSPDDPYALYGRLAQSAELAPDHSWIIFNIRPEARFNDKQRTSVTAQDVAFTFQMFREHGSPARKMLVDMVQSINVLGKYRIQFSFKPMNGVYDRALPMMIASMPVLSQKNLSGKKFDQTRMEPLVGSGPYRVLRVEPGRSITYARIPEYWGKDLSVIRGRYNVDRIIYEYFGTDFAAFEAFKKGEIDFWFETDPNRWATGYNFPAVESKHVICQSVQHKHPVPMTGFVFNTRKTLFRDTNVRLALSLLLDFEWLNAWIFRRSYKRIYSFFENTDLAAIGRPSLEERKFLSELTDMPDSVWGALPHPSKTDGSGYVRPQIREAHNLLRAAGWSFQGNRWIHSKTKEPFSFEILISDSQYQRVAQGFVRSLEKAGIHGTVRIVDGTQYQNRLRDSQFDMIVHTFSYPLYPGYEQKLYWLSDFAEGKGRNYAGVCSRTIDLILDRILSGSTQVEFVTAARVLDRFLRHGHYVIPLFHRRHDTVAYWKHLNHPRNTNFCLPWQIYSWWVTPRKALRKGE